MKSLLTLKIGSVEYIITENDKFCANFSSVTLLSRAVPVPTLKYKHVKQINTFERLQHPHKFGRSIEIFSLKSKD